MVRNSKASTVFLEDGLAELGRNISKVYEDIARAAQVVSRQLPFLLRKSLNPFGEQQAELDIISNETFSKALLYTVIVESVASEELDTPLV